MLWDQHCCLALKATADVSQLERYARPDGACVSVNVGYAPHPRSQVVETLGYFRSRIEANPRLRIASTVSDVDAASRSGQVAVAFDLEDSVAVGDDVGLVDELYERGVRTMLPTYNVGNRAGSGCLDANDTGLTRFGLDLVRRMNDVGMVVDASHCSVAAGLELCKASAAPVIYSHSGMKACWDHPRNITDAQAIACAETGGVIGIPGVSIFLGPGPASISEMVRHVDYAVDLVGIEHVGLGSDYCFDEDDLAAEMAQSRTLFPDAYTARGRLEFVGPEQLASVVGTLEGRGYQAAGIEAIVGGNFRRVAGSVWR